MCSAFEGFKFEQMFNGEVELTWPVMSLEGVYDC